MKGLSTGRIVHLVDNDGNHLAALVVAVRGVDGTVNLRVFADGSFDQWRPNVKFSEAPVAGTWHWVERED